MCWTVVDDSGAVRQSPPPQTASQYTRPPLDFDRRATIANLIDFEEQFIRIAATRSPGIPASRGLDIEEFRDAVQAIFGDDVTDEESDFAFWKIDVTYNSVISWQVSRVCSLTEN